MLPDGCADIIYTRDKTESTLYFVGPMTGYRDFALASGSKSIGIRFRPAMWRSSIPLHGRDAANQVIALDDLWGKTAANLLRRLDATEDQRYLAHLMIEEVCPPEHLSSTQRAIRLLDGCGFEISVDVLAKAAGLSERQFRRRCMEETSLTPKLLSRILRFRKAQVLVPMHENFARIALECGYFDQSHLIAEFKAFSGRTPTSATTAHRRMARRALEPGCR